MRDPSVNRKVRELLTPSPSPPPARRSGRSPAWPYPRPAVPRPDDSGAYRRRKKRKTVVDTTSALIDVYAQVDISSIRLRENNYCPNSRQLKPLCHNLCCATQGGNAGCAVGVKLGPHSAFPLPPFTSRCAPEVP